MTTLEFNTDAARELDRRLVPPNCDLAVHQHFAMPDTGTSTPTSLLFLGTVERRTGALVTEVSQIGDHLRSFADGLCVTDADIASTLLGGDRP
jgi:hypothetical protein